MARTAGKKIKLKTQTERVLVLPTNFPWVDGARFVLQKKSEGEWALSPEVTETPAA